MAYEKLLEQAQEAIDNLAEGLTDEYYIDFMRELASAAETRADSIASEIN